MDAQPGPRIAFYYDFVSPYAYLASHRLDELERLGEVVCQPVLFGALLSHWAHKGPAEIEPKRVFTYRQVLWLARRHDTALRLPPAHPFNPLPYLRLAIALGNQPRLVCQVFDFLWQRGLPPDDPTTFEQLAGELGLADAGAQIATDAVRAELRRNTEQAIDAGVFGVPSFICAGATFWGFDSIDFLLDCLSDPGLLEQPAMRHAATLPVGIVRKTS